MKTVKEFEA